MYQPRRLSESASECVDGAGLDTAFAGAPRRAARSRLHAVRTRIAPTALSLALLAGATAFSVNLKATEATTAVPAPVRAEDTVSRDQDRSVLEVRTLSVEAALAEAEAATAASGEAPADAPALVAGTWTSAFGAMAGDKFAQSNLTVRAQANSDSAKLGTLKSGAKIAITDRVANGYREVSYDGKVGYVLDNKLGDKAPVVVPPKPKPAPAPAAKAPAKASAAKAPAKASAAKAPAKTAVNTTYSGKSVLGLKPKAMVVYNAVTSRWSFSSIGGYRASSLSNHQYGGAIDFMLTPGRDSAKGWAVANYLAANASAFGIDHIIFEQKIWTPYRPYWRGMADRGGTTANHYDHVHVSVKL